MPKCPNCGRETARTEDWACQWCGYPLLSESYKKIPKTFKQLKEERLHYEAKTVQKTEPEPEIEPKQDLECIKGIIFEPETGSRTRQKALEIQEPEEEMEKLKVFKTEAEIEEEAEPTPEPESAKKGGQENEENAADGAGTEAVATFEKEEEKSKKAEEEALQEQEHESELQPAAIELTVDELFEAYETDEMAAEERFIDKILRISGVVATIDMKDILDINYIRLTGTARDLLQSVQCMFDKKHAQALGQLEKGQSVTVQGKYNGSVVAIRMVGCFLVEKN